MIALEKSSVNASKIYAAVTQKNNRALPRKAQPKSKAKPTREPIHINHINKTKEKIYMVVPLEAKTKIDNIRHLSLI